MAFLVIGGVGGATVLYRVARTAKKTFRKTWAAGAGSARKRMPLAGDWQLGTCTPVLVPAGDE